MGRGAGEAEGESRDLGPVSVSSAAVTNIPQAGWLKQQEFLTFLEAGRWRPGSVPGEVLLPRLLLCPHGPRGLTLVNLPRVL